MVSKLPPKKWIKYVDIGDTVEVQTQRLDFECTVKQKTTVGVLTYEGELNLPEDETYMLYPEIDRFIIGLLRMDDDSLHVYLNRRNNPEITHAVNRSKDIKLDSSE